MHLVDPLVLLTKHFAFFTKKFPPQKRVFCCEGKLADYGSVDAVCFSGPATELMFSFFFLVILWQKTVSRRRSSIPLDLQED